MPRLHWERACEHMHTKSARRRRIDVGRDGGRIVRSPPQKARLAVSGLFMLNGAAFANVVPRYPELIDDLGLTNTTFGFAIAGYTLGALVVGALGGRVLRRWSSGPVAATAIALLSLNLLLIGFAPTAWVFVLGLAIAGALDATADNATNAHGLRVERLYERSILNSMHGVWSIGAVLGGLMGAAAAGLGIPIAWHLSSIAAVFIVLAVVAGRSMLPGHDVAIATPTAGGENGHVAGWRLIRTLLALGLIAAFANVMEDVGATWGAVYLRGSLDSGAAIAGFGFIALQASQTISRFAGDALVTRFGDRAVARMGAALAFTGMTGAIIIPTPTTTIVAFALVGAGIGTLIPSAMRTAEALPGVSPGTGIAWVGTTLRLTLLVSPPFVGIVADLTSLRVALIVIPLVAAAVLALSGVLGRGAR